MSLHLPPPARTGDVDVGGRRVGWAEWGPAGGALVLFCAGAATSSSLGFGAPHLEPLGVRVRCVDRAGLGRSQPDPTKTVASYVADVRAVLAHDRVDAAAVIGFSQGAPFAIALAAAGIGRRLVLAAPQDELAHPRARAALGPELAGLVDAIARDRAAVEAMMTARADAAGMWQLVVDASAPIDRALYTTPVFAAAFRRALDEGFAQGAAGYARDLVLALSRWSPAPEDVTAPVELWLGALDTSPVHAPDGGAALTARFPRARRHLLADAGGSLLWTHGDAILASAIR